MPHTMPTTQLHMELTALHQLADVTACLEAQLQQWHVSEERQVDLKLCVMEAIQNALLYGGNDAEPAKAIVMWQCDAETFRFTVTDNGAGIAQELRDDTYQETLKEGGRGLLLMRVILDEVYFNEQGNSITGILRW